MGDTDLELALALSREDVFRQQQRKVEAELESAAVAEELAEAERSARKLLKARAKQERNAAKRSVGYTGPSKGRWSDLLVSYMPLAKSSRAF